MSSLVLELQRDAYNTQVPVSELLRKALVVARKLNIGEFEKWINFELNGYPEGSDDVPEYRGVTGLVMAHNPYRGWIPFIIPDAGLAKAAAKRGFAQPISEVEKILDLQKDDPLCIVYYAPEAVTLLMSIMPIQMTPALKVPTSQIHKIVETVRNIVLDWSLKLEADGILGEGMTFTAEEKQAASTNTYHIQTFIEHASNPQMSQTTLIGEVTVGDSYKAGQAGAMGPNAHAHDMTFNQIWNEMQGSVDLPQLAGELSRLRQEMKKDAVEPEHDIAVSEVAKAEQAAKAGEGSKVVEHLKAAGKFALDVGTRIGAGLVVEVLKKSIGM